MDFKKIIISIVGLLTIIIGILMINESKYNQNKFQDSVNKINNQQLNSEISGYYNSKSNALSLYGILSIVYGLIVFVLCAYCIYKDKR